MDSTAGSHQWRLALRGEGMKGPTKYDLIFSLIAIVIIVMMGV
jgi:hypothetical protein